MRKFHGIFRAIMYSQDGAIIIPFSLMFPILIGFVALAVEVGSWRAETIALQNLADTSAYSAGVYLSQANSSDYTLVDGVLSNNGTTEGLLDLLSRTSGLPKEQILENCNGDANSSFSRFAVFCTPPFSGPNKSLIDFFEIQIVEKRPRYLSRIYNSNDVTLAGRSVSRFGASTALNEACILTLSGTGTAIKVSGSVDATFEGCSIASNSTSNNAFDMVGAKVKVTAACLDLVGGYSDPNNELQLILECGERGRTNSFKLTDPYEGLSPPNTNDCYQAPNTQIVADFEIPEQSKTCVFFASGLKIGAADEAIMLDSGTYVINGPLEISSNPTISGNDITFYLTGPDAYLKITGTPIMELSAPTTGTYAGILFASNSSSTRTNSFRGNAGMALEGAFYFPTHEIDLSGNTNATSTCIQIVSNTLVVSGNNTSLYQNCEGSEGGQGGTPAGAKTIQTNFTVTLVE